MYDIYIYIHINISTYVYIYIYDYIYLYIYMRICCISNVIIVSLLLGIVPNHHAFQANFVGLSENRPPKKSTVIMVPQ